MLESKKSKRKPTGGLRGSLRRRDKRLSKLANKPSLTTVADAVDKEKRNIYRGKGGNEKVKAIAVKKVNVVIDGKPVSAEVLSVKKNEANKDFVRRNVITKGAEIKVSYKGKEYSAKVTSRPGQTGVVSAVVM